MKRTYQKSFLNFLHLQRVAPKTKEAYLRAVANLSAFHQKPAENLNNNQIQDYLLYCIQEKQLAWSSCNVLLFILKRWLGHASIKTTCMYLHASPEMFEKLSSPLDSLMEGQI